MLTERRGATNFGGRRTGLFFGASGGVRRDVAVPWRVNADDAVRANDTITGLLRVRSRLDSGVPVAEATTHCRGAHVSFFVKLRGLTSFGTRDTGSVPYGEQVVSVQIGKSLPQRPPTGVCSLVMGSTSSRLVFRDTRPGAPRVRGAVCIVLLDGRRRPRWRGGSSVRPQCISTASPDRLVRRSVRIDRRGLER